MQRCFLFLILGKRTWGEALLGLQIARELSDEGAQAAFLATESVMPLLKDAPFEREECGVREGWNLKYQIARFLSRPGSWSIVLCDYHTTSSYFLDEGLDPDVLLKLAIPIVALDTWDFRETGYEIDLYGGAKKTVPRWLDALPYRLVPVPIARLRQQGGAYANLPPAVRIAPSARSEIRKNLGLRDGDRLILWSTSSWQHEPFPSQEAHRIGKQGPRCVGAYVAALGKSVHLVHVGPRELPIQDLLQDRYHHLPQLARAEFDLILGSADLLLSLNFSATTVTRAIRSGIPTITVMNSLSGESPEELVRKTFGSCSEGLMGWLHDARPLFPFLLWPFGWHQFLLPLLDKNDYVSATRIVELLNEKAVMDALHDLLYSDVEIDRHRSRQLDYVNRVAQLPSAARLLLGFPSS
jgi:hypothetical protein